MPEWKHKARYADVQALRRDGWWPDKTVPAWAEERAAHYQTSPTAEAVLESAYVEEIERLQGWGNQLVEACKYLEASLRNIVEDCIKCPDTAQYAHHAVETLSCFGDVFEKPLVKIWMPNNIENTPACFQDVLDTLGRFLEPGQLDQISYDENHLPRTNIDVSPFLPDRSKVEDCIRLVISYWEEKYNHADTL